MKKITLILLVLAMVLSLCACGNKADTQQAAASSAPSQSSSASQTSTGSAVGLANPMHETTIEGVLEKTGIMFQVPADSENVKFFVIDGDPKIAQMTFTFDNDEYTYRIAPTAEYKDISGMYFEWQYKEKAKIEHNEADVCWNDGKEGVIMWYDKVPGLMYSLSQSTNANYNSLEIMAGSLYYCVQGDVGPDNTASDKDYSEFNEAFKGYLMDMNENLPLGTAGSSLKAAAFAGRFMDLFAEDKPTAKMLPDLVKEVASTLSGEKLDNFKLQLEAVKGGAEALNNGSSGETLLESCGYEAIHAPWNAKEMAALFEAMILK